MNVVVKREKDCSWLGQSIDRTCEWCSSPDFMKSDLPGYIDKPLDDWPADLLLDLCYCFDCVQEYHRLQEELTEQRQKKVLQHLDVDRLKLTISTALEDAERREGFFPHMQDVPMKLQVPLLEMLRFPYFLHNETLALWFKRGLIALNVCGCPLKLEEKLPGAYLLLVHPDPEVRGWAVISVRGQGMINPDEYDLLKEVIKWMIDVVEFNLFELSEIVIPKDENTPGLPLKFLPPHLYVPLTIKEYWMGLFVLLMRMDVATVQSCFMSYTGHIGILNAIVQPMRNQEVEAFWPMLQCFVVLQERLEERIWQISVFTYKPEELFEIITENCSFKEAILQWQIQDGGVKFKPKDVKQSKRARPLSDAKSSSGFYNTALAWFQPFVLSLLDFDDGQLYVSLVIRYLHNVADECVTQSTFKSDVQSTLLGIIHELVKRQMSVLLAPTAGLWAKDMVDFVLTETGDKKKVDVTRKLLQLLLKASHRVGSKHALKFWELFALPGPKELSAEEKQQIISLIEAQPSLKVPTPGFLNKSLSPANSMDSADIKSCRKASLPTQGVIQIKKEKAQQSHEQFDSNGLTERKSGDEKSFRSRVRPCPSSMLSSSEDEQGVIRIEKEKSCQSHEQINSNGLTKTRRNNLKNKLSFRARAKPGPSSRLSSSEDEEEEEEIASRDLMKKGKKPRCHLRNIKVSKMSPELGFELMTAKVPLVDCGASLGPVKAEKSVQHTALQTTVKHRRNRARKSAGRIKKVSQTPILMNSGAWKEDAIVLSDDEESSPDTSNQTKPVSSRQEHLRFLDDYLNCESLQDDDIALNKLMDEVDPSPNSGTTRSKNLSTKEAVDSDNKMSSSDEELLRSVFESDDKGRKVKVKSEDREMDGEGASCRKTVAGDNIDKMKRRKTTERDVFSPQSVRKSESRIPTNYTSITIKTESADSNDDLDDEPLAAHHPFAGVMVKTEVNRISEDEAINVEAASPVVRDVDCSLVKKEQPENVHNTSSFDHATDTEIGRSDFILAGCIDSEQNAQPVLSIVKPEPLEQGEEKTLSLSDISKQLQNDTRFDDDMNFWGHCCNYSELLLNSQDNALASIEEDLVDVYGTQTTNQTEDDLSLSDEDVNVGDIPLDEPVQNPDLNDNFLPDEEVKSVKPKKHVTFAPDIRSSDAVTNSSGGIASLSKLASPQAAITKPSRVLSEDDFFREILTWRVDHFFESLRNGRSTTLPRNYVADRVPESFNSMDEYYKIFKPLLFMEIWQQALGSWGGKEVNRKCVTMNVLDGSNANSFWIIPCRGVINEQQQKGALFPMESDLVLVTRSAADGRDGSDNNSAVFGLVEKSCLQRAKLSRRGSLGISGGEEEAVVATFDLNLTIKTASNFRPARNCRLQVQVVTSLLTALRQWSALMQFSKSLLANDILRPRRAIYFCSDDYRTIPHVAQEYNESQERVISTAANAVHNPYPIPRICLVQGPPGTGKSYTIVGLVKEILNRGQEFPGQTTATSSNGSVRNKVRILLCAPSNAAIDELIGRFAKAQIRLQNRHDKEKNRRCNRQDDVKRAISNNCGDLCLVRVGRKSYIHPGVLKFSLDSMTKLVVDQSSSETEDRLNKTKESLAVIDDREKKLERKITKLKSSPHTSHEQLEKLEKEKLNLMDAVRTLQKKFREQRAEQANKRRKESSIRKEILYRADIICTTLSGAGSTSLKQDLEGRRIYPHFTCVIVDEACQSNELDLLIPLCFQASKVVLVGDPEQLPCTVLSGRAKEKLFARSMFERLYRFFRYHKEEMEKPVLMLEEQYRMHPEIAAFPSSHVYNNFLRSHRSVEQRQFPLVKHYALFDVVNGREICQDRGALWNPVEADIILNLCYDLTNILNSESIGIITPYRKQKVEIQGRLRDLSTRSAAIEVNTVDGFQGREKDVIILSCVRAQLCRGSIGFLTDRQRMNVALTRARHALYVFGHMETLKGGSPDWRALIENAEKRGCFFPVKSSSEVQSILSIESVKIDHSPAKDPRAKKPNPSSRRIGYHRSSISDQAVDPEHAPGNVSGRQQEFSGGMEAPGQRNGRRQAEKLVNSLETKLREATGINANSTRSEPSLNSHSTRRSEIVNPKSMSREGNGGEERTHSRNRHQQFSTNNCQQLPRSEDHVGNQSVEKESKHSSRQSSHREGNAYQKRSEGRSPKKSDDDKVAYRSHSTKSPSVENGVSKEDKATFKGPAYKGINNVSRNIAIEKQSPRHSSEGSVHGKQMKPNKSDNKPDVRATDFVETASTSTFMDSNSDSGEIDSYNSLETDTPNPMLHNVIQNNRSHKRGYFCKLYRQEKEATARSSPAQRVWSPVDTGSPVDQALTESLSVSQPTSSGFSLVSSRPSSASPLLSTSSIPLDNAYVHKELGTASGSSSRSNTSWSSKPSTLRQSSEPSSLKIGSEGNGHSKRPQGSTAKASNALSFPSASGLSNGPFTLSMVTGTSRVSNPLNSSGLSRTLSLDEKRTSVRSAEQVAEAVRQRHPPALRPQVIEAPPDLFKNSNRGVRKRSAHAMTPDVSALRGRATREVSPPPKRSAPEPSQKKNLHEAKKYFRGRKSWN